MPKGQGDKDSGKGGKGSPPPPKFSIDEKVLAFFGELLYEAKVLKCEYREDDKEYEYWIHYAGWKKSWDEWIEEEKVLKYCDENLEKQEKLKADAKKTKQVSKAKLPAKTESRKTSLDGDSSRVSVSTTDAPSSPPGKDRKGTKGKGNVKAEPPAPPKSSNPDKVQKGPKEKGSVEAEPPAAALAPSSTSVEGRRTRKGMSSVTAEPPAAAPAPSSTSVEGRITRKGKGSATAEPPAATKAEVPRRKPKKPKSVEPVPETTYSLNQEVRIDIPERLKQFLADDWHAINRLRRLVSLPPKITVEDIFGDYLKEKAGQDQNAIETCGGLRDYFNTLLGSQLLYRFERLQLEEFMKEWTEEEKDKKKYTELFGAPHFLRLFTKLGDCLSFSKLNKEAIDVVKKSIQDLLKFLLQNFEKYFHFDEYGVSTPDYQRVPTMIYSF